MTEHIRRFLHRILSRFDAWFDRVYGWKHNPLYHSGALVVLSFIILLVTGVYLLLFYRIGSPYESVARITAQPLAGRWIRTLHRYASDLAVMAAAVHALRMFVQRRTWGPRAQAWISGLVLLLVFFICGWTGYVMVWDLQAQLLAVEGARLLDVLPIFSEPIGRGFAGDQPMRPAFFFLNLFAHILFPIGIGLILWIHVARVARPQLLPPRRLLWWTVGSITALSVVWPVKMALEADLLRVVQDAPLDVFYGFWVPLSRAMPAGAYWVFGATVMILPLFIPRLQKPKHDAFPGPSVVDERRCTGCEQCYHDCPYEAIAMIPREDDREGFVARVDPALCVSCGICTASCAPMSVGPPGWTGRDQLVEVKAFVAREDPGPEDVVLLACDRGAGGIGALRSFEGAPIYRTACVGSVHTSVIEYLIRAGTGGLLVVSCPPRDCWNREGVAWLEERVHHDREAELKARVDRKRLRITFAALAERKVIVAELEDFRREVRAMAAATIEEEIGIDAECETPEVSVALDGLRS